MCSVCIRYEPLLATATGHMTRATGTATATANGETTTHSTPPRTTHTHTHTTHTPHTTTTYEAAVSVAWSFRSSTSVVVDGIPVAVAWTNVPSGLVAMAWLLVGDWGWAVVVRVMVTPPSLAVEVEISARRRWRTVGGVR